MFYYSAAVNYDRAYKHYIIAAKAGDNDALDMVKAGFKDGIVTKDEYAQTLRPYQKIQDDMRSEMRDKVIGGTGLTPC